MPRVGDDPQERILHRRPRAFQHLQEPTAVGEQQAGNLVTTIVRARSGQDGVEIDRMARRRRTDVEQLDDGNFPSPSDIRGERLRPGFTAR